MLTEFADKYELVNFENLKKADIYIECATYNQEDYIEDALKGFLSQETSYDFFVIVIDDASTDSTQDILRNYARKYPEKIKLMLSYENRFGRKEQKEIFRHLRLEMSNYASFFATCEGDDFWTDPMKLQIQAEYMEKHPDCMMYLHNSIWFDCLKGNGKKAEPFECDMERDLSLEEMIILKRKHPATASRLFRNSLMYGPEYVWNCSVGDYNLMLYAGSIGKVHYSNRVMCTYRFMSKGSTTEMLTKNDEQRDYLLYHDLGVIVFLLNFDLHLDYRYHEYISVMMWGFFINGIKNVIKESETFSHAWNDIKKKYYLEIDDRVLSYLNDKVRQENDVRYVTDDLRDFMVLYDHIVLFGAGEYAKKMTLKMDANSFIFDGYMVSGCSQSYNINGKPVWDIKSIPYKKNQLGVIVAVMPKDGDNISSILKKEGFLNVIYPYDLYLDEVLF